MSAPRLCLLLASAALLASCGGGRDAEGDARSSSGEVLEGTISDAMLPVDTVRSQPPLLRPAPARTNGADTAAEDEAVEEGEAAAGEEADSADAAAPVGDDAAGAAQAEEGA